MPKKPEASINARLKERSFVNGFRKQVAINNHNICQLTRFERSNIVAASLMAVKQPCEADLSLLTALAGVPPSWAMH
jgi:hypothetical protein